MEGLPNLGYLGCITHVSCSIGIGFLLYRYSLTTKYVQLISDGLNNVIGPVKLDIEVSNYI